MGWKDSLQDASFRGVPFDVVRTRDDLQSDLALHEYPYLNGADIEDLGRKPRRVRMTTVFWGDDYLVRLNNLINALNVLGAGELIHPVFGSMPRMVVESAGVDHDADSPDFCTVDMLFVMDTPSVPFAANQLPEQKAAAVNQAADAARNDGTGLFDQAMAGLKALKGVRARLNALRGTVLGTLAAIRSLVRGYITTTLDLIDFPRAFAADVTGMLSGIVDLRGFDADVMMADWRAVVRNLKSVVKLPASVSSGTTSSGGGSGGTATGSGASGQVTAGKPLGTHPADVQLVTALVTLVAATTLADTAAMLLADEAAEPTLSPLEVEEIANDVRALTQDAIEQHRALFDLEAGRPVIEALKDMALAVQEAAAAVIDARPPLTTRTVDAPANLHLLAHKWYGDYARAAELARLNPQLINPNAIQPGDTLNAYAN